MIQGRRSGQRCGIKIASGDELKLRGIAAHKLYGMLVRGLQRRGRWFGNSVDRYAIEDIGELEGSINTIIE